MDCISGFLAKLQNWQRKVGYGNVAIFVNLSALLDENKHSLLDALLKTWITPRQRSLVSSFNMYFPEFEEEDWKLARNPFSGTLDITTIPSDVQDEFLDIKKIILLLKISIKKNLWMYSVFNASHIHVSEIPLRLLLPFNYSCVRPLSPPFYKSRIKAGADSMWSLPWAVLCQWHNLRFVNWLKLNNVSLPTNKW